MCSCVPSKSSLFVLDFRLGSSNKVVLLRAVQNKLQFRLIGAPDWDSTLAVLEKVPHGVPAGVQ